MNRPLAPLLLILLIIFAVAPASSSEGPADADFISEAAQRAQGALGRPLDDLALIDQDGAPLKLSGFKGRPLVLNFVYTGCAHVCPAIMTSLRRALEKTQSGLGDKFKALTIGLDPENDTPARMKAFGENLGADFKKWTFASGDKNTIEKLAGETGFYFKKTGSGYDHLNLVTVIDSDGKVFRQVYGAEFRPDDLLAPLSAALNREGRNGFTPNGLLDRIKLLCYTYDEATGAYKFDYSFLMAIVLGLIVQTLLVLLIVYLFRGQKPAPGLKPRF